MINKSIGYILCHLNNKIWYNKKNNSTWKWSCEWAENKVKIFSISIIYKTSLIFLAGVRSRDPRYGDVQPTLLRSCCFNNGGKGAGEDIFFNVKWGSRTNGDLNTVIGDPILNSGVLGKESGERSTSWRNGSRKITKQKYEWEMMHMCFVHVPTVYT